MMLQIGVKHIIIFIKESKKGQAEEKKTLSQQIFLEIIFMMRN